jgi:uncharacterized FlaG/YvyC family protein
MIPVNTIAPSTGAPPVVDRVPSAPVAQAVATELSPGKSVTAAETAQPVRNDMASSSENYQHTVVLDPATQDLIFRVVDVRSRQVVRQVPDEALLRMRAYSRAIAQGKGMNEALNAANLEI